MKISRISLFLAAILLLVSGNIGGQQSNIIYFYEPDCPNCIEVNETIIPEILRHFNNKVNFIKKDVGDKENFKAFLLFEQKYGIAPQEIPVLYTSFGAVKKSDNIGKSLNDLISLELSSEEHGPYSDFLKGFLNLNGDKIFSNNDFINNDKTAKIKIYYFYKNGCSSCDRINLTIKFLSENYKEHIEVKKYNIKENSSMVFHEALCIKYNVPEKYHLTVPAVFFSDKAFIGDENLKNVNLATEIPQTLNTPEPIVTKTISKGELNLAGVRIRARYDSLSWGAVLAAGLLDGINPCAFVTIIFLISYLSMMKYNSRAILWIGSSFISSVFLTYLLIGTGLLKFISIIQNMAFLKEAVYFSAIGISTLIGILNIRDFFKIRRGSLKDMSLKLSDNLRKKVNDIIRHNVKLHHYIIAAFLMGVTVSVLELACTGQVYLPTILYIVNTKGIEASGFFMLLGYNFAFIIPLLLIFFLFWKGLTSDRKLSRWLENQGANIKLIMGLLLLSFSSILIYLKFF